MAKTDELTQVAINGVDDQKDAPSVQATADAKQQTIDLIVFDDHDPDDPKNWSETRKRLVLAMLCLLSFCG